MTELVLLIFGISCCYLSLEDSVIEAVMMRIDSGESKRSDDEQKAQNNPHEFNPDSLNSTQRKRSVQERTTSPNF